MDLLLKPQDILKLLMYWIMGQNSKKEEFEQIK